MARVENGLSWKTEDPSTIFSTFNADVLIINKSIGDVITLNNVAIDDFNDIPSSPIFEGTDIHGRSSPPQTYAGGETRTLSFQLHLHRDLIKASSEKNASDLFVVLLNKLKAFNYPIYSGSGVVPPMGVITIGNYISCKGYITTTFDYKRPIDRWGRYMVVDVNVTVNEVLDIALDATEVRKGGYVFSDANTLRR